MCLAVPMEIKKIEDKVAFVEIAGVTRQVRLDIIDQEPQVGDFVIIHAGFALRRVEREEAIETIKIFEQGWNVELL